MAGQVARRRGGGGAWGPQAGLSNTPIRTTDIDITGMGGPRPPARPPLPMGAPLRPPVQGLLEFYQGDGRGSTPTESGGFPQVEPDVSPLSASPAGPLSPGNLSGPMSQNPDLELYGLQQRRREELADRMARATRGGSPTMEIAGLKQALGGLDRDIEESPLTQQGHDVDAYRQATQRAIQGGFTGGYEQGTTYLDPVQQAGRRAQEMESSKLQSPERIATIESQGALARQQEASKGALAVAESKGEQLQDFMNLMSMGGGRQVSRLSAPGGGSVSFAPEQEIPVALTRDVLVARQAYENAKQRRWGWQEEPPEKTLLDQAIASALGRHPAPPEFKEWALAVAHDPNAANVPLGEILNARGENVTPEEYQMLQDLLAITRGH